MIIRKYGIELRRVTHGDIEMIRQARNRDDIRTKMLEQRIITPAQQEHWFASINNARNFYFIVQHQQKPIGLIHSKNIDWTQKEDEGGLFIWDDNSLASGAAVKASILLMQLCFSIAELERTHAQTHTSNSAAYHYNLALGYQPLTNRPGMVLTRDSYNKRIDKLRWLAAGGKPSTPLSMADIEFPDFASQQHLYTELPPYLLKKIKTRL